MSAVSGAASGQTRRSLKIYDQSRLRYKSQQEMILTAHVQVQCLAQVVEGLVQRCPLSHGRHLKALSDIQPIAFGNDSVNSLAQSQKIPVHKPGMFPLLEVMIPQAAAPLKRHDMSFVFHKRLDPGV